MYEIKDRIGVGILFDGIEFPLGRVNVLNFLHISCSTRLAIPIVHLSLFDQVGWFDQKATLADGAAIQVQLSRGTQETMRTYKFRLNSFKTTRTQQGVNYEIDGYLDLPRYWNESSAAPLSGTSATALKEIANRCGMSFEGDSSSDTQVWYPRNAQYHSWASSIALRGYIDDSSCMQLGVEMDGGMIYRNVSEMSTIKAVLGLSALQDNVVLVTDYKPITLSGATNHYSGYGEFRVEQRPLQATDKFVAHKKVSFNKNEGGSLLVSKEVKSAISQNRVQFGPLDPGNTHEEAERALYQNRRVSNLFSAGLEMVTPNFTQIRLLDTVNVDVSGAKHMKLHSGTYRVISRAVYISGSNYYEKLEVGRRTLNAALKKAQVESDPGELTEVLTP